MTSQLPLDGVKVLDVASWIAAPAAAVVLGDWGADVVKVEPPGEGDPHRLNGVSLTSVPKSPVNYLWHLDARNKRSVALDLKHPDGRATLARLIGWADVLITNFPHPVRARLALDYESVRAINPRLIYASFTGYGEAGPDKDQPGFDSTAFFGRSGISDLARYEGQPPGVPLPAQGDRSASMSLACGILMALLRRHQTGEGGLVASSLYANGLWSNGIMAQAALLVAYVPRRAPRGTPRSALWV
jgi:formyl-CoA transferase